MMRYCAPSHGRKMYYICYINDTLLEMSGDTFDEAVIAAEYGG